MFRRQALHRPSDMDGRRSAPPAAGRSGAHDRRDAKPAAGTLNCSRLIDRTEKPSFTIASPVERPHKRPAARRTGGLVVKMMEADSS